MFTVAEVERRRLIQIMFRSTGLVVVSEATSWMDDTRVTF